MLMGRQKPKSNIANIIKCDAKNDFLCNLKKMISVSNTKNEILEKEEEENKENQKQNKEEENKEEENKEEENKEEENKEEENKEEENKEEENKENKEEENKEEENKEEEDKEKENKEKIKENQKVVNYENIYIDNYIGKFLIKNSYGFFTNLDKWFFIEQDKLYDFIYPVNIKIVPINNSIEYYLEDNSEILKKINKYI
jgi:DNA mismatch repair ATPase MutL